MATLTIELDSLSPEGAQRIAAMILTYAGIELSSQESDEEFANRIFGPSTKVSEHVKVYTDPQSVEADFGPSASEAFGSGPQLVVPNPPPPPSSAAGNAVGHQVSASVSSVSVQLDSAGLPHDPRIHSKEKTFNKDGSWRIRRGLPDGYAEKITEENRKLMAIPSPLASKVVVAPVTPAPTVTASAQSAEASYGATAAGTLPPPPPPPAPTTDPMAFVNLATKVTSAISAKQNSPDQVQKVAESVGLQTFMQLAMRQDLVPQVSPLIDALLAGNASAQ